MQQRILKTGRLVIPAACVLALGACFPSSQTEVAATPAGAYGGTVVAYPAPGYYSPYGYGYGYDEGYGYPAGAEYLGGGYGYAYAPYLYAYPRIVVVHPAPTNRYAVPRGQGLGPASHGQYGLRSTSGTQTFGGLSGPTNRAAGPPVLRLHSGSTAQPRFTMPPLRPSTGQQAQPRPRNFNPPPQRQHMTPPPPRPSQSQSHQAHRG